MYDLPPGFGSAEAADQQLGFHPAGAQGVQFSHPVALGNPGVLEGMNPWVLASIGAVVVGGAGGALGYQKSGQTAAIAGGVGAVVGGLIGYYVPALMARMSK
jgi:hypothetical protein